MATTRMVQSGRRAQKKPAGSISLRPKQSASSPRRSRRRTGGRTPDERFAELRASETAW